MEEYFTLKVTHTELYENEKGKKTDWIVWCWENIGQHNFDWTLDISSQIDLGMPIHYVYYIRFKNEGDKVLFILNWL